MTEPVIWTKLSDEAFRRELRNILLLIHKAVKEATEDARILARNTRNSVGSDGTDSTW